jgi:hypothetical protein
VFLSTLCLHVFDSDLVFAQSIFGIVVGKFGIIFSRRRVLCFKVAVSNEDRERLLSDAEDKYFAAETSVVAWVSLKIILDPSGGETFWCGWGRRRESGSGLRLVDQTEYQQGIPCFIPVHAGVVTGDLRIATRFIFPVNPPVNIPPDLTITFESLHN